MYHLVEKNNHHALHGIFHSKESAIRHLKEVIPQYLAKSYFMDKSLTADSFEIISAPIRSKKS